MTSLLAQAKKYAPVASNILNILEARDLCDPYLSVIHIDEESSNEQMTLAVILKWVSPSWVIDESCCMSHNMSHLGNPVARIVDMSYIKLRMSYLT